MGHESLRKEIHKLKGKECVVLGTSLGMKESVMVGSSHGLASNVDGTCDPFTKEMLWVTSRMHAVFHQPTNPLFVAAGRWRLAKSDVNGT